MSSIFLREVESTGEGRQVRIKCLHSQSHLPFSFSLSLSPLVQGILQRLKLGSGRQCLVGSVCCSRCVPHWLQLLLCTHVHSSVTGNPVTRGWEPPELDGLAPHGPRKRRTTPSAPEVGLEGKIRHRKWEDGTQNW